jgi:1-acyl-sn-glycerol-3-phosphate acyltransferase
MQVLRSALFNIAFYLNLTLFLVIFSPLLVAPRKWCIWVLKLWACVSIRLLQVLAGVRLEVRGLEHIPDGPFIVAAKHQSLFETFAVLPFLQDPAMVLKRELMLIPLFGWFAMKCRMIPVNRNAGASAMRKLMSRAQAAVRQGRQVLIFPEGTRRPPGAPPKYRPGATALYLKLDVACVPLALNSGLFWPRRKFMRYPGTIVLEFLPPIPPGLEKHQFSDRLEEALEIKSLELLGEKQAVASN